MVYSINGIPISIDAFSLSMVTVLIGCIWAIIFGRGN